MRNKLLNYLMIEFSLQSNSHCSYLPSNYHYVLFIAGYFKKQWSCSQLWVGLK